MSKKIILHIKEINNNRKAMLKCIIPFIILLKACTYNVSMAHTEGTATDTIEDTSTNTPNIVPTISVPITPKPF